MEKIKSSELIINPDGSVYHINLKPEHIANDVIFVGDQYRVDEVAKFFDTIEFETQKREFKSKVGTYKGKRITVISTGIGPDNIDIVMNELDALVNIDFETRAVKDQLTQLNIYRFGTSGSLQKDIPVDAILLSSHAIGTDNILRSYQVDHVTMTDMEDAFIQHTYWNLDKGRPYAIQASEKLMQKMNENQFFSGITITAGGFYGAQGRVLRLAIEDQDLNDKMDNFTFQSHRATNLEMETAAIYGLAKLLGHEAISINAIIANRANGTFSTNPYDTVEKMIQVCLDKIVE